MFADTAHRSLSPFSAYEPQLQPLPSNIAEARVTMKNGELRMENRFANIADRYTFRSVYISSPKIEIFVSFLFPEPQWHLPVYGAEVVVLSGRPIVGVLDTIDVSTGAPAPELVAAQQHFQHLPRSDDMPQWFLDCRSGAEFFMRPGCTTTLEQLLEAHDFMLQSLATSMGGASPHPEPAEHKRSVQQYKHHHNEHSPGRPLLKAAFGAAWTESYMNEFLFA